MGKGSKLMLFCLNNFILLMNQLKLNIKSTTICTDPPLPLQTQPTARFQLLHAQQRCDIEHPDF